MAKLTHRTNLDMGNVATVYASARKDGVHLEINDYDDGDIYTVSLDLDESAAKRLLAKLTEITNESEA